MSTLIPTRVLVFLLTFGAGLVTAQQDDKTLRVFVFAGQSNMVGSDSKVKDVQRFPPFAGTEQPQPDVKFSYCIGRENKRKSDGWVALRPVNGVVGPELSFARQVSRQVKAPIAIIKCAAGGTHLGGDWNPDEPSGFKMYPHGSWSGSATALADLKRRKIPYRTRGLHVAPGRERHVQQGLHAEHTART